MWSVFTCDVRPGFVRSSVLPRVGAAVLSRVPSQADRLCAMLVS